MSSLVPALAVYAIFWWLTLFIVLPYGNKSQAEAGEIEPGTDPGAPVRSRFALKLVVNTLISAVLFAIALWLISVTGFSFDTLPSMFPQDR